MTRKVILYIATSIDGYIADVEGKIDWLENTTEIIEEDNRYEEFYAEVDTVILGRTTYDQIVKELSPNHYPYEDCQTYVLTSHPKVNKEKLIFKSEPVSSLVKKLKNEKGKNIWLVGGSSVVMPLVEENLIDEYQLSVLPIILGKGIPLFKHFPKSVSLKMEEVSVKNGIVTTTYARK